MKVTAYIPCPSNSCNVVHDLEREKISIQPILNNRKPLCALYNDCIRNSIEKGDDLIILCHHDIIIESNQLVDRILWGGFDVTGVAGTSKVALQKPALWHVMGGGFGSGHLHGAVAHGKRIQKSMTAFGYYPARAVMLDGVFLAIKRAAFEKVQFDETNPAAFHFYDLSYSLDCHMAGFKVGVGDILLTHESPGLRSLEEPDWVKGQEWFLNKYGNREKVSGQSSTT